jgi:Flp pilus assembly protein TadD
LGIPNACNRCHADKSVDWALKYAEQWYGAKLDRHTRERAQWIGAALRGEESAKAKLVGLLSGGKEAPYWRAVEAGLLSRWAGEREVQTVLLARLKDEHPLVREKTVRALEPALEVSNEVVAAALKAMLNDPVRNVRVAAAWVLRATVDMQSHAGRELERSLALDADQPTGQYRQAMVLLARQRLPEALLHLQKAVEWDPFSPPLRYECAMVLSQLGRTTEALATMSQAEKLAPDDPQVVYGKAAILARAGRYEEARVAANRALELRWDFEPAKELLQQLRGKP